MILGCHECVEVTAIGRDHIPIPSALLITERGLEELVSLKEANPAINKVNEKDAGDNAFGETVALPINLQY